MGKISPAKAQVNAVVPRHIKSIINARADALDLTPSYYAALLFEDWQNRDYPWLSEPDKATAPGVMRKLKSKWAADAAKRLEKAEMGETKASAFHDLLVYLQNPQLEAIAAASGQKKVLAELQKNAAAFFDNIAPEKTG